MIGRNSGASTDLSPLLKSKKRKKGEFSGQEFMGSCYLYASCYCVSAGASSQLLLHPAGEGLGTP